MVCLLHFFEWSCPSVDVRRGIRAFANALCVVVVLGGAFVRPDAAMATAVEEGQTKPASGDSALTSRGFVIARSSRLGVDIRALAPRDSWCSESLELVIVADDADFFADAPGARPQSATGDNSTLGAEGGGFVALIRKTGTLLRSECGELDRLLLHARDVSGASIGQNAGFLAVAGSDWLPHLVSQDGSDVDDEGVGDWNTAVAATTEGEAEHSGGGSVVDDGSSDPLAGEAARTTITESEGGDAGETGVSSGDGRATTADTSVRRNEANSVEDTSVAPDAPSSSDDETGNGVIDEPLRAIPETEPPVVPVAAALRGQEFSPTFYDLRRRILIQIGDDPINELLVTRSGCMLVPPHFTFNLDLVRGPRGFYYREDPLGGVRVVHFEWSGNCRDGLAHGPGTLVRAIQGSDYAETSRREYRVGFHQGLPSSLPASVGAHVRPAAFDNTDNGIWRFELPRDDLQGRLWLIDSGRAEDLYAAYELDPVLSLRRWRREDAERLLDEAARRIERDLPDELHDLRIEVEGIIARRYDHGGDERIVFNADTRMRGRHTVQVRRAVDHARKVVVSEGVDGWRRESRRALVESLRLALMADTAAVEELWGAELELDGGFEARRRFWRLLGSGAYARLAVDGERTRVVLHNPFIDMAAVVDVRFDPLDFADDIDVDRVAVVAGPRLRGADEPPRIATDRDEAAARWRAVSERDDAELFALAVDLGPQSSHLEHVLSAHDDLRRDQRVADFRGETGLSELRPLVELGDEDVVVLTNTLNPRGTVIYDRAEDEAVFVADFLEFARSDGSGGLGASGIDRRSVAQSPVADRDMLLAVTADAAAIEDGIDIHGVLAAIDTHPDSFAGWRRLAHRVDAVSRFEASGGGAAWSGRSNAGEQVFSAGPEACGDPSGRGIVVDTGGELFVVEAGAKRVSKLGQTRGGDDAFTVDLDSGDAPAPTSFMRRELMADYFGLVCPETVETESIDFSVVGGRLEVRPPQGCQSWQTGVEWQLCRF